MRFDILTIFPDYFDVLNKSIVGKAIGEGKFDVEIINIRDFSKDKHFKTDDTPYGGGAGMVMTPDPIFCAIEAVDPNHDALRIYMSPKGKTLKQCDVVNLAKTEDRILILCGDYEGIDERVIDLCIDEEMSIGDYVLTGGELPALVLVNAVSRYLDGVLGSEHSTDEESFSSGLLEYPQYTRPQVFKGLPVPEVLQGGNHKEIEKWRTEKSIEITINRRPDLFENVDLKQFMPKKKKKKFFRD
ncbi:MAG: tRNA (guanosine(37)-N1)-methyltransferase TrmD [Clostridia bacterium]